MIDRTFLELLFGECAGLLDVRALSVTGQPARQRFIASVSEAASRLASVVDEIGTNLYVGIATRRSAGDGSKANLRQLGAVWIDVDYADEGDAEALAVKLETFPLAPSMRVSSGGGQHVYWLFQEPFDVDTPESVARVELVLKGLCAAFDADRNATDASRILRIPGSTNYPDERKRAKGRVVSPCVLIEANENRYSLDDFDPWEIRGRELADAKRPAASAPPTDLPERVRSVLETDRRAADRFLRDARGLADPSASGVDLSLANALLRHATITRDDAETALRSSRARAGEKPKDAQYFARTIELAVQAMRPAPANDATQDRAGWLRHLLRDSRRARMPIQMLDYLGPQIAPAPRWPSTIEEWDRGTGGFYGISMLAGIGGAGKSIVALASALCAAATGWTVAYMNAELPVSTIRMRLSRMMAGFTIEPETIASRLNVFGVHDGATMDDVVEWTCSLVESTTQRVLVVLDSLNTLATYTCGSGAGDGGYFRELDSYLLWSSEARRHSEGAISFLMVSELNRAGIVKGGTSEYRPDVVMALKRSPSIENGVHFEITKSRETKIPEVGDYVFDFQAMRLRRYAEPAGYAADDWANR